MAFDKDRVYLKLQTLDEIPDELSVDLEGSDIYSAHNIMLTMWYQNGPMVDEHITEVFPDIEDTLSSYDIDELTEGMMIIFNSPAVDKDTLAEELRLGGFSDIRYMNSETDEEEDNDDEDAV